MPNKNYISGRRKEYKLMHEERVKGCLAFRSAGSHSPIDVVSIDAFNSKITLIQSKPNHFSENQKKKLLDKNRRLNGVFYVEFVVR